MKNSSIAISKHFPNVLVLRGFKFLIPGKTFFCSVKLRQPSSAFYCRIAALSKSKLISSSKKTLVFKFLHMIVN